MNARYYSYESTLQVFKGSGCAEIYRIKELIVGVSKESGCPKTKEATQVIARTKLYKGIVQTLPLLPA